MSGAYGSAGHVEISSSRKVSERLAAGIEEYDTQRDPVALPQRKFCWLNSVFAIYLVCKCHEQVNARAMRDFRYIWIARACLILFRVHNTKYIRVSCISTWFASAIQNRS